MICWLSPDGVRDGICRTVRFRGDASIEGDGIAGGGCGVGVPAGESLGDSRELMSILTARCAIPGLEALTVDARLGFSSFRNVCKHPRSLYVMVLRTVAELQGLYRLDVLVANGMGREAQGTLLSEHQRRRIGPGGG